MSSTVASTMMRISALFGSTPTGRSATTAPVKSFTSSSTSAGIQVYSPAIRIELGVVILEEDAAALGLEARERVGVEVDRDVGVVGVQGLVEMEPHFERRRAEQAERDVVEVGRVVTVSPVRRGPPVNGLRNNCAGLRTLDGRKRERDGLGKAPAVVIAQHRLVVRRTAHELAQVGAAAPEAAVAEVVVARQPRHEQQAPSGCLIPGAGPQAEVAADQVLRRIAQLVERQELHRRQTCGIEVDFIAEVQRDRIVQVDGAAVDRLGPSSRKSPPVVDSAALPPPLPEQAASAARAANDNRTGRCESLHDNYLEELISLETGWCAAAIVSNG
jgi:hypothetical protein